MTTRGQYQFLTRKVHYVSFSDSFDCELTFVPPIQPNLQHLNALLSIQPHAVFMESFPDKSAAPVFERDKTGTNRAARGSFAPHL